ncbi:MAG: hypothetical protein K2N51_15085 [Lachnospiraceae bacterium]|nr:hypothetical protein [Lachnospiraceae bacterium]
MAQECGFFNSKLSANGEYDRVYLAEQFAAYFASFIGNGIYGKSMQKLEIICKEVPDMSIKVLSGEAWINGWWYRNTDEYNLSIQIADGVLSRIDAIVLRWGNTERDMWLDVITGEPSANPKVPTLRRDADYYDLMLGYVSIPAGSIKITQAQITDTRLDNAVCGLVTGVVDQIDTTDLYNQFTAYFNEFKNTYELDFNNWSKDKKNEYDTWSEEQRQEYDDYFNDTKIEFDSWYVELKDKLTESEYASLVLEMEEIKKSGRDGKKKVANAITNKGVSTAEDATFQDMATNISKIFTGYDVSKVTASADTVLTGRAFVNSNGTLVNGTMPNRGAVNTTIGINGSYTIPAGYHNGSGKVSQSITTKGAQTYVPTTYNQSIAAGQYLSGAQTIQGDGNLIPANIKKDVSIFGIKGTLEENSLESFIPFRNYDVYTSRAIWKTDKSDAAGFGNWWTDIDVLGKNYSVHSARFTGYKSSIKDYSTQPSVEICRFGLSLAPDNNYSKDINKGDIILLLYEVITQKVYVVPYINHGGNIYGGVELSNGVIVGARASDDNNVNNDVNMTNGVITIWVSTKSAEDKPFQLTIAGIVRK